MQEVATLQYTHELQREDDYRFRLFITLPWTEVDARLNAYAQDLRKVVQIPGYRPGRAPVELIRRMLHRSLEDQLREWFPEVIRTVVQEQDIDVLVGPEIVHYSLIEGEPLVIECTGILWPTVELRPFDAIRPPEDWSAERERIAQQEIEQEIRIRREKQAILEPVEGRGIRAEDVVTLQLRITDRDRGAVILKDELVTLDLANPLLSPVVVRHLEDRTAEEEISWEMDVSLDWLARETDATESEVHRIACDAKIVRIYRAALAPIEEILEQEGMESEAEWRAFLQEQLHPRIARAQQKVLEETVIDAAIADYGTLPDFLLASVVREEAHKHWQKQLRAYENTPIILAHLDRLKSEVRPVAERQLARQIAVHQIARAHRIEVTDADLNAIVEEIARLQHRTVESLRALLEQAPDERRSLEFEALFRKVAAFICQQIGWEP